MKPLPALGLVAFLAACGADGAPEAPASMSSNAAGLTISGCASVGVTMGAPTVGGPAQC